MRRLALPLAVLIVAGCAVLRDAPTPVDEPWVVAAPVRPQTESESLLVYYDWTRRMNPADLARELEAAREAFNRLRSDFNRMRHALVLAVPGGSAADKARALELLEPLARSREAKLHPLALLIYTQLSEVRRASSDAAALQQRHEAQQQRLEAAQQKLEAAQQRGDALQQKLDALKALEKRLSERGGTAR